MSASQKSKMGEWRELLTVAKSLRNFLGELNDCRYCRVIFYSRYGVDYQAKHKRNCPWAKLQRSIKRLEAA